MHVTFAGKVFHIVVNVCSIACLLWCAVSVLACPQSYQLVNVMLLLLLSWLWSLFWPEPFTLNAHGSLLCQPFSTQALDSSASAVVFFSVLMPIELSYPTGISPQSISSALSRSVSQAFSSVASRFLNSVFHSVHPSVQLGDFLIKRWITNRLLQ